MPNRQVSLTNSEFKRSRKSPVLQKKNLFEQLEEDTDDQSSATPPPGRSQTSTKVVYTPIEMLEYKENAVLFTFNPLPDEKFWRLNVRNVTKMNSHLGTLAPGGSSKSKYHHPNHHNPHNNSNGSNSNTHNNNHYGNENHRFRGKKSFQKEDLEEPEDEIPEWLDETDFKVDSNFTGYTSIGKHTYEDFEREKWQYHKQFGGLKQHDDSEREHELEEEPQIESKPIPGQLQMVYSADNLFSQPLNGPSILPRSENFQFLQGPENKDQRNNQFFNDLLMNNNSGSNQTPIELESTGSTTKTFDTSSKFEKLFQSTKNSPTNSPTGLSRGELHQQQASQASPQQHQAPAGLQMPPGIPLQQYPPELRQQQSQHQLPIGLQMPPGFQQPGHDRDQYNHHLRPQSQSQLQYPQQQQALQLQRQQMMMQQPPPGFPNQFPPHMAQNGQFPPGFNPGNMPPPTPGFNPNNLPPPPPELLQLIKEGKMPPLPNMMQFAGQIGPKQQMPPHMIQPHNKTMPYMQQDGLLGPPYFPQHAPPLQGFPPGMQQQGQVPPPHIMDQLQQLMEQQKRNQQQQQQQQLQQQPQHQQHTNPGMKAPPPGLQQQYSQGSFGSN